MILSRWGGRNVGEATTWGGQHRRESPPVRPDYPLTAPVRPPTMRRWKIRKKMTAGTIDNEVKASTLAVSTEYCDANDCTPSGNVYDDSLFRMKSGSM